jgi:4-amino-4-deoxy-L-arabinose transferase-like glycosyltransferase
VNPWLAALLAVTALRLVIAAIVPLAPDEAYYWVWSRALQPGYFDHPPMVALFIRAGTLLACEGALGIRLMGPISIAVVSVLLARAADSLFPARRRGIAAAVLFNATMVVGLGSILATSDLPLLVFWTAALWALARLHATQDGRWWLVFGLLAGLALASKYTAILLGLGVVLWLAGSRAAWRWWRDWRLHAGGALALLVFSPVLAWNAARGWVSLAKQGGRAGADTPGLRCATSASCSAARSARRRRSSSSCAWRALPLPRRPGPGAAMPPPRCWRRWCCPGRRSSSGRRRAAGCRATGRPSSTPAPASPPPPSRRAA